MNSTLRTVLLLVSVMHSAMCLADADGWAREPYSSSSLSEVTPKFPDLNQYTKEAIDKKLALASAVKGTVQLKRIFQHIPLSDFTSGERALEWAKRQKSHPQAIVISAGVVNLTDIGAAVNDPQLFEQLDDKTYISRLPIVVEHGAALLIDGKTVDTLRLSMQRGAFINVEGQLYTFDTGIVGWDEKNNAQAFFVKSNIFRPFIASWEGSEIYLYKSRIKSLGYNKSKSYGISLSRYTNSVTKHMEKSLAAPTGWLLENTFEDIYYGFYCYEAEDVVIKGNTYVDNIVYAIDPHDRSERLVIADNTVYGTKLKHGIIISREVNNSWIINNRSFKNRLSGIVLDRQSSHNLIANNEVYENGTDGITLYESSHNLIWKNKVFSNGHHGIRSRNSMGIAMFHNEVVANQRMGIYGQVKDLSATDRDFIHDPYEPLISLNIVGGIVAANSSGALLIDKPENMKLYGIDFRFPVKANKPQFKGFLADRSLEILETMHHKEQVLVFRSPSNQLLSISSSR